MGDALLLHLHLPNFDVGGTERWAHAMAKGLPGLGWRLSATKDRRVDAATERLLQGWDRFGVDEIPAEALVIAPCDFALLAQRNRRVIAVAHGMNAYYREILAEGGYWKGVAVSAAARDTFPVGVAVTTIHNGVDVVRLAPTRSRQEIRQALGIPAGAVVIGFVGRWSAGKNPLAAAFAAAALPGGVALYVGPCDPASPMVREAARIADCRFVSPGDAANMGDLYAAMDVCLVASKTEGFSLVIAEAWYVGAPVMATPVGIALEHPDLVVSLPPDPGRGALEAAVTAALNPRRADVLVRARETVLARYTEEAMMARWRAYLRDVAACFETLPS